MSTAHTSTPGPGHHAPAATGIGAAHLALVVGAIGVVFGDIGTSPLYTLKEAFTPHYGLVNNHDTVIALLSWIF